MPYWSIDSQQLLHELRSDPGGLTTERANEQRERFGPNRVDQGKKRSALVAFLAQLSNPLAWLLVFAMFVSSLAGEWTDAFVVLAILLLGAVIGFMQERRAARAVEALVKRVAVRSRVLRDGQPQMLPVEELVPGDIALLAAGALVPADGVVLAAKDFFVVESVLTGETYPVEKRPGAVDEHAPLAARRNTVFFGTSVRSGTARVLIAATGRKTEYGRIAERVALRPPELDFERGIRHFGQMLTRVMFVMVMFTTAVNVVAHKPPIASLLFAIALAVGLAPEMLPAVVALNLSRGAQDMAKRGVIVRRLASIENFGAMDLLCTDKTGTLTEGVVSLDFFEDVSGAVDQRVLELAYANALLETGLENPLDDAIVERAQKERLMPSFQKVDEIPYDFLRKRLSVVIRDGDAHLLVAKGALSAVLDACRIDPDTRDKAIARAEQAAARGVRVLAVATRRFEETRETYHKEDEVDLRLEGLLGFRDPPKEGVVDAIRDLRRLGVGVKIISGDSAAVARHLATEIGLSSEVLTGADLDAMHDEALWHAAERTTIFAEVDPNQKERIILSLRKMGHVVGYMGDGINDAPALHAADVSVSVEGATDVARAAADFVLLRRDLAVLRDGVLEGRATFANTLKYLFTTESANFGNMVSMALAAAFLPFLPLLATQVLANNFLSDIPAMAIGSDEVDEEYLERPRRWDIRFMRRFMTAFGLVSTAFDLLTFYALYVVVRASAPEFRTGWFVESLMTELMVAFVVRTRRPFFRSRPANLLLVLAIAVSVVALALPYTPVGSWLALVPLPASVMALVLAITVSYVLSVEVFKRWFFKRYAR